MATPCRLVASATLVLLAAACTAEDSDNSDDDDGVAAGGGVGGGTGGTGAAGNTGGTGNAGAGNTGTCPPEMADCDNDGTCETDLTSNEHCGACNNACTADGECNHGGCVEPVSSDYVCAGAKDGSSTYWLMRDDGDNFTVRRIPYGGGALEEVGSAPSDSCGGAMAVDADNIYLVTDEAGSAIVYAMPKSGGFFSIIHSSTTAASGNTKIGVGSDGVQVYWVGEDGIYRAPVEFGTPQLWVATYCITHLVVNAGTAYWSCVWEGEFGRRSTSLGPLLDFSFETLGPADSPAEFAVDSSALYWVSNDSLRSLSLSGGTETVLASGDFSYPGNIDVDSSRVFFGAYVSNESIVFQAPKSGGSAVIVGDSGTSNIQGDVIASDGTHVYAGSDGLFQLSPK